MVSMVCMVFLGLDKSLLVPSSFSPFLLRFFIFIFFGESRGDDHGTTSFLAASIQSLTMSEVNNSSGQSAAELLLSNKLFSFCKSDSLLEEGLRKIIERHPNNISDDEGTVPNAASVNVDVYGCLPLHHACFNKNVTLGIIQLLIEAAPDTVRSVDNNGCVPLHFICHNEERMKQMQ